MIDIKLVEPPLSDDFISEFIELSKRIFDSNDAYFDEGIRWRMSNMPDIGIFVAMQDKKIVAYKGGYATANTKYYSWLGGVDPDYRQKGIAKRLMQQQHEWLRCSRFELVETHVSQKNMSMISLNQACGMVITGMYMNDEKPYFIMRKKIEK